MANKNPTNFDDIIDSRDVIEAIEEMESERQAIVDAIQEYQEERDDMEENSEEYVESVENERNEQSALRRWDSDNADELRALQDLASQGEDYAADWIHGEILIRYSYFKEYAMDLAEDIGAIDANAQWPANCIDWDQAARELQMDYSSIEFDGVTYWVR